jgi:hypothetical protein
MLGTSIVLAALVLHLQFGLGEHLSGLVFGIGTAQFPTGRLRDRFRWKRSRTSP